MYTLDTAGARPQPSRGRRTLSATVPVGHATQEEEEEEEEVKVIGGV